MRAHPLALIFEGASGRGKSTVINMCEPDRDETKALLFRLDSFTPRSFVSHAANVSPDALTKVDLLPQLKDKTLLTKELAPLFRGKESDLRANFAILTAVLDGRGFASSSGVHGVRSYKGRYLFNWLGATTPIPATTDAVMSQLGNRLLRYQIIGEEQSEEKLIEFAKNYQPVSAEGECQRAVNDFIFAHFEECPQDSVYCRTIDFVDDIMRQLVLLATLVASGRVEVATVDVGTVEREFVAGDAEGPERVILLLRTLLQGLVLIGERREVTTDNMDIIRHVAFSSIPKHRREILQAVLTMGGELGSSDAERILNISRPAARDWMKELAATRIVNYSDGKGRGASTVTLSDKWKRLLTRSDVAETKQEVCV